MIERQFSTKVRVIRSGIALELGGSNLSSKFFAPQGIIHQTSCVHTPQKNEVIKRKHKHLLEVSKSLLHQSKLPISYWKKFLRKTTFLINKCHSRILKGMTPHENCSRNHQPIPSLQVLVACVMQQLVNIIEEGLRLDPLLAYSYVISTERWYTNFQN